MLNVCQLGCLRCFISLRGRRIFWTHKEAFSSSVYEKKVCVFRWKAKKWSGKAWLVCGKCVGQLVSQVNKVSLSLGHALSASIQVLSNHNNWSRRLAGGNKGTSVLSLTGTAEGNSAVLCSPFKSLSCCNSQQHRALLCGVCVRGLCLNNLQARIFLRMCLFMSVWVCAREDSIHAFLPAYSHTDMQVIIRYCTPVVFFPPHSPLRRLCPWMRGLFGFSSGFPLCTVTPVLIAVSWPGHTAVFFHLSLKEEMISDWERWGRNDKLIHPTSEPGLGAHCKPF